jgi:hypothetical protein
VRQSASETDTPQGLHVEGTMSIGYEALQSSMDTDGVRLLKEVRLWEGSIVTFPMNESATISSVKSLSLSDDEVQMRLQSIARHQKAIRMHLKCLLGDDLDDGDAADDALLEGNDSEADDEMGKVLLKELQALAMQAGGLASA